MVVGTKNTSDGDVAQLGSWRTVRRPLKAVTERMGLNELDGIGAYGLVHRDDFAAADLVHYHAIHGGWFSYPAMPRATKAKPSVLTLHDLWPLTGHCSFSFECDRWRHGCGSCPHPEVFPAIRRDATAVEWRVKDRVWAASSLSVVTPSAWLATIAAQSMLGRFPVEVIPHGIDTDVFAPTDRATARAALRLPVDQPIVMFAASSVADRRKGSDLVLGAVDALAPTTRKALTVILMGGHGEAMSARLVDAGCQVADFGYVASDRLQALLYSAADVFVFPTRADNSPLVALEALACATPVVSFDVGGVAEMVRHGVTGLLAPAGDIGALTEHLTTLLEDTSLGAELGHQGRSMVIEEHNEPLAARRHLELYARVLDRPGALP
jgi:glycosyltransferase involved in cell wall biosynthesis